MDPSLRLISCSTLTLTCATHTKPPDCTRFRDRTFKVEKAGCNQSGRYDTNTSFSSGLMAGTSCTSNVSPVTGIESSP